VEGVPLAEENADRMFVHIMDREGREGDRDRDQWVGQGLVAEANYHPQRHQRWRVLEQTILGQFHGMTQVSIIHFPGPHNLLYCFHPSAIMTSLTPEVKSERIRSRI